MTKGCFEKEIEGKIMRKIERERVKESENERNKVEYISI